MAICEKVLPYIIGLLDRFSTTSTDNLGIAWIAVVGVVTGAIISSVINYFATRTIIKSETDRLELQIKSSIISKQRQQWMDTIRVTARDLLTDYDSLHRLLQDQRKNRIDIEDLFLNIRKNSNQIHLMLNPQDREQSAVDHALVDVQSYLESIRVDSRKKNDAQYNNLRSELLNSFLELFRYTWSRIKYLDF